MNVPSIFFSIIIPSFNRENELILVLSSLESQSYENFEVVIVDDCSTNPIVLEKKYSFKVKLIRNESNQGAAASRNIAVEHAVGEWMVFLDDDDIFANNKLKKIQKVISENNAVNFIYHKAKFVMVNENIVYETNPEKTIQNISVERMLAINQLGGTPMHAIKREFFLSLGGFNTKLMALEDYEFLLRMVEDSRFNPIYIDKALTTYRCTTQKKSVSKNEIATVNALNMIEKKYNHLLLNNKILRKQFQKNKLNSICYLQIVNLDRRCGLNFLRLFLIGYNPVYLLMASIGFINPSFLIYIRKYKK